MRSPAWPTSRIYVTAGTELDRSRRYGHQLSLLYIDVDNFKRVNDVAGHNEGDRVLRSTRDIEKKKRRKTSAS